MPIEFYDLDANNDKIPVDVATSAELNAVITDLSNAQIKKSSVLNAVIDVQNMNTGGVVTNTTALVDSDWVDGGNIYTYNSSALHIVINAQVHQEIPSTVNAQRPGPVLILEKSTDGGATWTVLSQSATGYVRDANLHEESSNGVFYRDIAPASGTSYRLSKLAETNVLTAVPSTTGQFDLEACYMDSLFTSVGGTTGLIPTLPDSAGALVSDNFQDQGGTTPFTLQLRNTGDAALNWEAFLENVPYSIANGDVTLNAGPYTVQEQNNGDGTFTYLFAGTSQLAAFNNIVINGSVPNPVGTNTGLSFYSST